MDFGERLVDVREYLGFNQLSFAQKLDLAPQSLSRYEKNKVKPSIELLKKLLNKFEININWILTGDGEKLLKSELSIQNTKSELITNIDKLNNTQLLHISSVVEFELNRNKN